MLSIHSDEHFMREALKEAQKAFEKGEIPVGAVVVSNNQIISRAYNQTELLSDVTAHAEMLAITAAANHLGGKYLSDCTLFVTLEPCVMCAGALTWSQIGNVVYAAKDIRRGYSTISGLKMHPKTRVCQGPFSEESEKLLLDFFRKLRN
ncbi:nucleoside deaminase [Cytophaga hutchinsonii]|uniref:tRNA-specific adenosine deaminase n=1 Tax=Cytophaga hutchinsonii (strain ATCC 33406 / DSM 1761 / CIP 103989 / NBRC 15051 / NCIMB 9469 / D465) TaxID=269798 RepID=A0A6N4SMC0_CYTH3|nr:nucleoside deaminase [Cytophaga hutchinsonii]ABG57402.1 cytosine/adenosine deaminase [Cytophaga hutchinsonii ATCC 33406]SFX97509.1 tRNA(adenine34) deaminase [Cytophaga hutchinsonii ATCC 33406]